MTPTETDAQVAEKEFHEILYNPAHPKHEPLMRGDEAVKSYMASLSKRITPEPPPEPVPTPAPPVPQPASAKVPAETWGSLPAELSNAEQAELRAETARGIDELRNRWADRYDSNMHDMVEMRDALFDRSAEDRAALEMINGALGSNPDFIDLLRSHKATFFDRLKSSGPVDISGLSPQREKSLLIALAQTFFKDMGSAVAKAALQIEDFPDGRLRKWALRTAVRIFGR
jgi:hypothetical protein